MTSKPDARSLHHIWSSTYETAPPQACQTLRNYRNVVEWGYTCVFAEENGDPVPFSINTACMPWVTPNVYPNPTAFYSPATACPTSWAAVSTMTTGDQWVTGEKGLACCPAGLEGDGRGGCKIGNSGMWPVVECGEADAEENENRIYAAGQWPASATVSIPALHLRYQASDIGLPSATGSLQPSTASTTGSAHGSGGLSTAAKAAIGTVIPLIFILAALAFFILWRRRKQKKARVIGANLVTEKSTAQSDSSRDSSHQQTPYFVKGSTPSGATTAHSNSPGTHETPEWNVEMDATDGERQPLVSGLKAPVTNETSGDTDVSELGGLARLKRKPIPPVEIDSTPVVAEVGDAYIPYRPEAVR